MNTLKCRPLTTGSGGGSYFRDPMPVCHSFFSKKEIEEWSASKALKKLEDELKVIPSKVIGLVKMREMLLILIWFRIPACRINYTKWGAN